MNCYVTREMAEQALSSMQSFHAELDGLYGKYGFDLKENLGRRNILLSQAQEAFFAKALKSAYPSTTNDGRTGEPDIVIPELSKELECKLTSRQKSGAISFQSDYETLQKKGALDYLYVIASEDFDEFVVVHYSGLTVEDFRPLSNGARGKVQLRKHAAAAAQLTLGRYQRQLAPTARIRHNTTGAGGAAEPATPGVDGAQHSPGRGNPLRLQQSQSFRPRLPPAVR